MKSSKKFILNCMVCLMVIGCVVTTVPKVVHAAYIDTVVDYRIESVFTSGGSKTNYQYKTIRFNKTYSYSGQYLYNTVRAGLLQVDFWYKYTYKIN